MSTKPARPGTGAKARKGKGSASPTTRTETDPLARRMLRAAFADRGSELLGLCLVLGGLLAGLSIYFDRAGVVGRLVDDAASWSVGLTKLVLPVAMVLLGFAMFRERYEFGEITRRMPVGGILCLAGLTGLFHLGRDTPGIDDGADALGGAGGLIGLGVGGGLDAAVATWGAVLILVGLVLVGLAVVTRTTARQAAAGTVRGLRPVGRAIGDAFRSLLTPPGDPDAPVLHVPEPTPLPEPVPEPEPVEQPVEEAQAPKRRRKKQPAATDGGHGGEQLRIELGPATAGSPWKLPSVKALALSTTHDVDAKAVEARGVRLVEALAAHGVETRLVDMTVGPTVTRYALQVAEGVKVGRIANLAKDIAYELAAADVRILAPIPGQRAVGIEVPNEEREIVALGDILASPEAAKATHPLEAAIGRDINGRPVMLNLATMPHILIAGATGAGKSSCINALVTSILVRSTPDQVRMILIDPKRVEMGQYEGVPHLLTAPVTDPKKAANALHWAVKEMERRYDVLSECGFRDITGYNAAFDRGDLEAPLGLTDDDGEPTRYERMRFILIVVDELSDLMMVAARDVEDSICRIAQMARAVGIHLVVATQRPSVNVITGVIKANIPARLAFAVSSLADSRVILDQQGAERLVGKGDMLLLGPSSSTPQRIQGAWVGEEEVRQIVQAWRRQAKALGDDAGQVEQGEQVTDETPVVDSTAAGGFMGEGDGRSTAPAAPAGPVDITAEHQRPAVGSPDDDELLEEARRLVVSSQLGSTSMLQRKLRVGFARAGRLMDLLEEAGVVGPSTGSKAREVLVDAEEFENLSEQGL
ncbi:MAG: DNA translocase FtsK [Actinobacteria bacterium]|nr:DNA translocase FtsK [Actinomycetota bacterium]